jgi:hypothetical protein
VKLIFDDRAIGDLEDIHQVDFTRQSEGRAGRPLDSALSLVGEFLAERSEVPALAQPPRVAFVSSAHIAAVR